MHHSVHHSVHHWQCATVVTHRSSFQTESTLSHLCFPQQLPALVRFWTPAVQLQFVELIVEGAGLGMDLSIPNSDDVEFQPQSHQAVPYDHTPSYAQGTIRPHPQLCSRYHTTTPPAMLKVPYDHTPSYDQGTIRPHPQLCSRYHTTTPPAMLKVQYGSEIQLGCQYN